MRSAPPDHKIRPQGGPIVEEKKPPKRQGRIFITGGAGYCGSRLVPALLADGYDVTVYDTFWFGDNLPEGGVAEEGAPLVKHLGDIRDVGRLQEVMQGCDAVIHLACLSNDPSSDIDEELTKSINLDAFEPLVLVAKDAGVKRFIYCSTSSVYGVSDAPDVREDHPHVPITLYNTFKSQCEPILMEYASADFEGIILRPSTHCGYSPRQRLDLAVNILTNLAYNKGVITVFGGAQKRPNIHVDDVVDCYRALLAAPAEKVAGEVFNVGAGNATIADLAAIVQKVVSATTGKDVAIETKGSVDPRSYQVNSDKIQEVLGFHPTRTVEDAVRDLCDAFAAGKLPDSLTASRYFNVERMKEIFENLYKDAPPSAFRPQDGVLSEIDMKRGAGQ